METILHREKCFSASILGEAILSLPFILPSPISPTFAPMDRYQNPLLFLAGLLTGGGVVFVLMLLLQRTPAQESENLKLQMELLDQQNRMLRMQLELQDSTISDFKAILADTTARP
jgi:hypothetical protein